MTTPKEKSRVSLLIDRLLWLGLAALTVISLWPKPSGPETGSIAKPINAALLGSNQRFSAGGPREKPLLIEAFASWCGACRRNSGLLNSFEGSELSESIDTIALSVDSSRAAAQKAKEDWPILGPVAFDDTGRFNRDFAIEVLPTFILIDRDGKVLRTHTGGLQPSQLAAWIEAVDH